MLGDNIFDVTKGKSKGHYTLLIREKAKPPKIVQKLYSNFHFNSDHLKQIFTLPHSIVVESYVKAFQYKVINSILYTDTKLYKPQVAQARNMSIGIQNISICMEKNPIVSVTYENESISVKNSLPYLKCVLRLSCVIHGPIYGRFIGFYVNDFLSV